MQRIALCILIFCNVTVAMAWQPVNHGVKLRIVNQSQQPVSGATIQLMKTDSVIVKVQVSDQSGMAEFNGLVAAKYIIQVSHAGFQSAFLSLNFHYIQFFR